MRRAEGFSVVLAAALLVIARPAGAQTDSSAGVRAAGMAGAFTAAVEDASAVVWNPAALASGSYFSVVADVNLLHGTSNAGTSNEGTANEGTSNEGTSKDVPYGTLLAVGTPPLGLSYRRTVTLTSAGTSSTAAGSSDRNTAGEVRTIVADHFGVTLVHSLADGLAVGATLKLVRAGLRPFGPSAGQVETLFDADIGLMKAGSLGRLGLTISNARQPVLFSTAGEALRLDRRVRAGAAINIARATLVAADVDLNRTHGPVGFGREIAFGVEHQPFARTWIRGGVKSERGEPALSAGASYAVYARTQVDAQVTWSSKDVARSWGLGIRWVF